MFFVLTAVIDKQNSDIKKVSEFKYKFWDVFVLTAVIDNCGGLPINVGLELLVP